MNAEMNNYSLGRIVWNSVGLTGSHVYFCFCDLYVLDQLLVQSRVRITLCFSQRLWIKRNINHFWSISFMFGSYHLCLGVWPETKNKIKVLRSYGFEILTEISLEQCVIFTSLYFGDFYSVDSYTKIKRLNSFFQNTSPWLITSSLQN